MTRFEELQRAYEHASEARQAYWIRVYDATERLLHDFTDYLGISPNDRIPVLNSAPLPALAIGWMEQPEKFEYRRMLDLPRQGDSLQFMFRVVFGTDRSGEIPIDAIFQLSINEGDEGLFIVQRLDAFNLDGYRGPSFEPLFESMMKDALKRMVP